MSDQQTLLRDTMQRLQLTRDSFADRIGVTRRALDGWLLPQDSKQHRAMPAMVARVIEQFGGGALTDASPSDLRQRITRPNKPHLLSVDAFDRDSVEDLLRV